MRCSQNGNLSLPITSSPTSNTAFPYFPSFLSHACSPCPSWSHRRGPVINVPVPRKAAIAGPVKHVVSHMKRPEARVLYSSCSMHKS
jgi:hypothetical protein